MKRIVLLAIVPYLILSCTPEEKIKAPGFASVQTNTLKNFEYFTYNEYKPKFKVNLFIDPSKKMCIRDRVWYRVVEYSDTL